MQAVLFDADVHFDNVVSGGVKDPVHGDFKVQSRKMLGYVQVAPSSILVPATCFRRPPELPESVRSAARSTASSISPNPATDAHRAGSTSTPLSMPPEAQFCRAARGSLILPKDGSWSVVKQQTDTGDVKPVEEGQSVPLIKPDGSPTTGSPTPPTSSCPRSGVNFGVLQSTGTQKLLFNLPQFSPGRRQTQERRDLFRRRLQAPQLEKRFPQHRKRAAADERRKRSRYRRAKA